MASAAVAALAVFASAAAAGAQPVVQATLDGELGRLGLAGAAADTQSAVTGQVTAGYGLAGGRVRLAYDGDLGTLGLPGDWSYDEHRIAATGRLGLREGLGALFAGADVSLRGQGTDWGVSGHRGAGAFLRGQWSPAGWLVVRGGWRGDVRRFDDLAALDHVTHDLFATLRVNLPTRTTLIAEAHQGWKAYEGGTITIDAPSPTMVTRGRGRGAGLHVSTDAVEDDVKARLVSWLVRGAQSLDDRTGLSVQWSGRERGGDAPPALVPFPPTILDDGVYDDPFASDARSWRVGLKRVVSDGGWIEASGLWGTGDYAFTATDAAGADLPGAPLRHDAHARIALDVSVPVAASHTGDLGVSVRGGYAFLRRTSNDAFYSYRSHAVTLGVTLALNR